MRQLSFFQVLNGITKNCVRCTKDFQDYSKYGRARVCPGCLKPRPGNAREFHKPKLGDPLTPRELQIADGIVAAEMNKEIAWKCKISPGTAKVYVTNLYIKAGVTNRVAFTLWWLKKNNKLVA